MKELKGEIEKVMETGKVLLGSEGVIEALLNDEPKLVMVSGTCSMETAQRIKYYCSLDNVPCKVLHKNSLELGNMCGKPFRVSTLGVMKEGESKILKVVK